MDVTLKLMVSEVVDLAAVSYSWYEQSVRRMVRIILWEAGDDIAVIKLSEYDRFYWSFNHIFADDYTADYSYKRTEILC